ncbi:hypothetical protein B0H19DRAFT_1273677 [Mycena capillaripes]|nr:hypothetical protein B0H19DRAFT_1273677 [Mycena capillaripes]
MDNVSFSHPISAFPAPKSPPSPPLPPVTSSIICERMTHPHTRLWSPDSFSSLDNFPFAYHSSAFSAGYIALSAPTASVVTSVTCTARTHAHMFHRRSPHIGASPSTFAIPTSAAATPQPEMVEACTGDDQPPLAPLASRSLAEHGLHLSPRS